MVDSRQPKKPQGEADEFEHPNPEQELMKIETIVVKQTARKNSAHSNSESDSEFEGHEKSTSMNFFLIFIIAAGNYFFGYYL